MPPSTFFHYVNPNLGKRRTFSKGNRGIKSLLTGSDVKFAGAVLACADRGNNGMSRKEATDLLQDINLEMTQPVAMKQLSRVVLPKNHAAGILKKVVVKVQPATSDHTNINIAQQY